MSNNNLTPENAQNINTVNSTPPFVPPSLRPFVPLSMHLHIRPSAPFITPPHTLASPAPVAIAQDGVLPVGPVNLPPAGGFEQAPLPVLVQHEPAVDDGQPPLARSLYRLQGVGFEGNDDT
ncbi:hypothetical protein FRC06_009416 [Ceratobasidium sp. 370]|nr:hypothetical protein FRC06_009416 [Ceratobasidium sp. 370]